MEKLRAGIDFILSSYKRTAAILFIAALTHAIPITISLVSQQQDIRQRAQEQEETDFSPIQAPTPTSQDGQFCIPRLRPCAQGFVCENFRCVTLTITPTPTDAPTATPTNIPTLTCIPRPPCLDGIPRCLPPEPIEGWCPATNTPTPVPTNAGFCGDGICQNVACLSTNCPVPESVSNCPQDCSISPTATPAASPTATLTPTSVPGATRINLSLQLTGIGNATESARGINNKPKRPTRNVDIKFFNAQNQEVLSRSEAARFDLASGLYKGTITLGANFQGGPYILKVRMDNALWKTIPGIQSITSGTTHETPVTVLVSGDVNQDNEINLRDYTIFLTCYRGRCEGFPTVRVDIESLMYAFNVKFRHE